MDADKDGVIDAARFLVARALPVVLLGGSFGYARFTDRGETNRGDSLARLSSSLSPEEEPEASLEKPCPSPALMTPPAHGFWAIPSGTKTPTGGSDQTPPSFGADTRTADEIVLPATPARCTSRSV